MHPSGHAEVDGLLPAAALTTELQVAHGRTQIGREEVPPIRRQFLDETEILLAGMSNIYPINYHTWAIRENGHVGRHEGSDQP